MYCHLIVYNQHTSSSAYRLADYSPTTSKATTDGEQPNMSIIGKTNKKLLALVLVEIPLVFLIYHSKIPSVFFLNKKRLEGRNWFRKRFHCWIFLPHPKCAKCGTYSTSRNRHQDANLGSCHKQDERVIIKNNPQHYKLNDSTVEKLTEPCTTLLVQQ
ncbi:hypothetical protein BDA99DRAFT_531142 [Phascolomyces articulosus]|uniref:Uncharacterized protein n=1 Tax=Phascolomyces articulosus TaxID=60185 RepID=A0AAD5PKJ1_9FUNG|nr:hypothetical protein BDA99DRAFT_531142 [Phascolomyces articulosus]